MKIQQNRTIMLSLNYGPPRLREPKLWFAMNCLGQCQTSEKEGFNLVYYDTCCDKIIEPEYEIYLNTNLTVYKEIDEWPAQYSNKNNTIKIPRILFASGNELRLKRWFFLNCKELCDGTKTENGKKRQPKIFI